MDVLRQMLAVAAVFALLGVALWKLRRAGVSAGRPPGLAGPAGWFRVVGGLRACGIGTRGHTRTLERPRERPLERVDRLALTPQHMLHLVRVQGREWVVATHPQGCSFLPAGSAERDAEISPGGVVS